MAAEVSGSNILCDSINNLSCLAKVLHFRFEKLKAKRTTREMLHVTANDVLRICEFSKKTIEEFEVVVRYVLHNVDGASNYGKKTSISSSKDSENYKKSNNGTFPKFIPAYVLLQKMSLSMLDKYPVFYDCQLYRLRKYLALTNKPEEPTRNISKKKTSTNDNKKIDETISKNSTTEHSRFKIIKSILKKVSQTHKNIPDKTEKQNFVTKRVSFAEEPIKYVHATIKTFLDNKPIMENTSKESFNKQNQTKKNNILENDKVIDDSSNAKQEAEPKNNTALKKIISTRQVNFKRDEDIRIIKMAPKGKDETSNTYESQVSVPKEPIRHISITLNVPVHESTKNMEQVDHINKSARTQAENDWKKGVNKESKKQKRKTTSNGKYKPKRARGKD